VNEAVALVDKGRTVAMQADDFSEFVSKLAVHPCLGKTPIAGNALKDILAQLRMVQITLLMSRGCGPIRSQEAFHLLDGQDRNKLFDLCPLLKLVYCGTQHPFNLGYWTRELFT
jgi:hypothetical protein